ncbi:MAG: esterase-like activity of phytase family protein [Bdellovibrionota bacterium]
MNHATLVGIWKLKGISDQKIIVGGFSGLCCAASTKGDFKLVSISDRGPNEEPIKIKGSSRQQRPFISPDYTPEIFFTTWSESKGWHFEKRLPLSWADTHAKASGIPNSPDDEEPVDINGHKLPLNERGIDTEGIALDADAYWAVEEYGPSLLKIDSKGRILGRWIPEGSTHRYGIAALPKKIGERAVNRGFEGVTIAGDTLYAFLQSPLAPSEDTISVLAWDTKKEKSLGLLEYPLHDPKANKIGDASALGDGRILVLEQDGKTKDKALRKVFVWNPSTGHKELVVDLTEAGYVGREKAEGLAMLSHELLAVVSDNDYALRSGTSSELAVFKVKIPN